MKISRFPHPLLPLSHSSNTFPSIFLSYRLLFSQGRTRNRVIIFYQNRPLIIERNTPFKLARYRSFHREIPSGQGCSPRGYQMSTDCTSTGYREPTPFYVCFIPLPPPYSSSIKRASTHATVAPPPISDHPLAFRDCFNHPRGPCGQRARVA